MFFYWNPIWYIATISSTNPPMKVTDMFVVYSCNVEDDEVLVTTLDLEKEAIEEWFKEGGRDISLYERTEHRETAVQIRPGGMRLM